MVLRNDKVFDGVTALAGIGFSRTDGRFALGDDPPG